MAYVPGEMTMTLVRVHHVFLITKSRLLALLDLVAIGQDISEPDEMSRVIADLKAEPARNPPELVSNNNNNSNNSNRIQRRNSRFFKSPHCAVNRLRHVRWSGPGTIVCKSCAIHRALHMCNMLRYMPCGMKGQLSY